ncbi:MAG: rhodanese-like domain-containing protein [Holophagaceae bacterium]|nr:rhodanese-like domain-containing protein [Holophagaceae bacterium]
MMRMKRWMEIPVYIALALLCAWCSNALAGPTRRLSWRLKEPTAVVVPNLKTSLASVSPPAPVPVSPLPSNTEASIVHPALMPMTAKIAKAVAPVSAPPPDPKTGVMARFPPLVQEAQAAISGDEAVWLYARGAIFLDARRTALYTEGHIPGAKSFSAWEDGLPEKVDQLSLFTADLKLPVVIYCSGGECHDSHLVAQKLWLAGFRNLRIYADGYPDWVGRKLAVSKGDKP